MKTIIFIILFSLNASAVKLVVLENGKRTLINVGMTGSYYDNSKVQWDERVDGPIPRSLESDVLGEMSDRQAVLMLFDSTQKSIVKTRLENIKDQCSTLSGVLNKMCLHMSSGM